jgi:hypothetical protein
MCEKGLHIFPPSARWLTGLTVAARRNSVRKIACMISLCLMSTSPLRAQEMAGMHHAPAMGNADNMHMMPATVTKADAKTGLLDVNSKGMALRLHFHPASLAGIKAGDKVSLYMGFSKP